MAAVACIRNTHRCRPPPCQISRVLQKDAEQESQMRAEIQGMKQELSTVNMMDEFARYARLERKINKMTDKLKTHGTRLAAMMEGGAGGSRGGVFVCGFEVHVLLLVCW